MPIVWDDEQGGTATAEKSGIVWDDEPRDLTAPEVPPLEETYQASEPITDPTYGGKHVLTAPPFEGQPAEEPLLEQMMREQQARSAQGIDPYEYNIRRGMELERENQSQAARDLAPITESLPVRTAETFASGVGGKVGSLLGGLGAAAAGAVGAKGIADFFREQRDYARNTRDLIAAQQAQLDKQGLLGETASSWIRQGLSALGESLAALGTGGGLPALAAYYGTGAADDSLAKGDSYGQAAAHGAIEFGWTMLGGKLLGAGTGVLAGRGQAAQTAADKAIGAIAKKFPLSKPLQKLTEVLGGAGAEAFLEEAPTEASHYMTEVAFGNHPFDRQELIDRMKSVLGPSLIAGGAAKAVDSSLSDLATAIENRHQAAQQQAGVTDAAEPVPVQPAPVQQPQKPQKPPRQAFDPSVAAAWAQSHPEEAAALAAKSAAGQPITRADFENAGLTSNGTSATMRAEFARAIQQQSDLPPQRPIEPVGEPEEPDSPSQPETTGLERLGEGGSAIVDNYYAAILDSLNRTGDVPSAEMKSSLGIAWKKARASGATPDQFVDVVRTSQPQSSQDWGRVVTDLSKPQRPIKPVGEPEPIPPAVPEEASQLGRMLNRAIANEEMQAWADEALPALDDAGITPKSFLDDFFETTYPSLDAQQQGWLKKRLSKLSGIKIGQTMATDASGNEIKAESPRDLADMVYGDFGNFEQMAEEGYMKPAITLIAMMGQANNQAVQTASGREVIEGGRKSLQQQAQGQAPAEAQAERREQEGLLEQTSVAPPAGGVVPPSAPPAVLDSRTEIDEALRELREIYPGVEISESEPESAADHDAADFLQARGYTPVFTRSDDPRYQMRGAWHDKLILLRSGQDVNSLWRAVGHELAHATGLDKGSQADEDLIAEYSQRRLERASPGYRQRMERNPDLMRREGVAELVGEFMSDPDFRAQVSRENPTLYERLRDAILSMFGKLSPRDKAAREALDALRDMPARGRGLAKKLSKAKDNKQSEPPDPSIYDRVNLEAIPEDLSVSMEVIREKTGERVQAKVSAREAMRDLEESATLYKQLLDCLS